jgi:flagellar biosynthesis/type III secretory pathway protein FliH
MIAWRGRYDGPAMEMSEQPTVVETAVKPDGELMTAPRERKYALAVTGASLVLLAFGFALGHAGGANIDAAKAAGASAGDAAGAKIGKKQGYAAGYKKGYRTSYKAAYERAKNGD